MMKEVSELLFLFFNPAWKLKAASSYNEPAYLITTKKKKEEKICCNMHHPIIVSVAHKAL